MIIINLTNIIIITNLIITITTMISGMFYRSASLYHPQRRAIMHLKNQKRLKVTFFEERDFFVQEDQDQEGGQEPAAGRESSFCRLLCSSQPNGKNSHSCIGIFFNYNFVLILTQVQIILTIFNSYLILSQVQIILGSTATASLGLLNPVFLVSQQAGL